MKGSITRRSNRLHLRPISGSAYFQAAFLFLRPIFETTGNCDETVLHDNQTCDFGGAAGVCFD